MRTRSKGVVSEPKEKKKAEKVKETSERFEYLEKEKVKKKKTHPECTGNRSPEVHSSKFQSRNLWYSSKFGYNQKKPRRDL